MEVKEKGVVFKNNQRCHCEQCGMRSVKILRLQIWCKLFQILLNFLTVLSE